jgi:16S rRNA (uracil1498-N3)-methyltransferase
VSAFWVFVERFEAEEAVSLTQEEARHVQARRLRVGDPLTVFDGRGRVAEATLVAASRRDTRITIGLPVDHPRPDDDFVLASAVPKGDRLSTLLQMLTQLGVGRWQPLVLDDSAVRKVDPEAPRLRRVLLESAKLARRPWCMEIEALRDLEGALDRWGGGAGAWFGDVRGERCALPPDAQLLLIGPEAGFSDREQAVLERAGARALALSDHNLRIETAAIAGATAHRIGRATGAARSGEGRAPDRP